MCEKSKASGRIRVLVIFGTRPEAIKLAPVVQALRSRAWIDVKLVSTTQQADLLPAFLDGFSLQPDHQLEVMVPGQSINRLLARLIREIAAVLETEQPAAVIVQGDTTSCLAGALAARMHEVDVVHVEAGLRTGRADNPFPEELNRRLVSQLASLHCAATPGNRATLLAEGHAEASVAVTGNPVVDAIDGLVAKGGRSPRIEGILARVSGGRLLVMTAHRRESFGSYMDTAFAILRGFVECHADVQLVFPVHPNPAVSEAAGRILGGHDRIHLAAPLDYADFIGLCRAAWLIVSDSGGIQEEAASLGKPLLVLRAVTERPEALACGIARLVGADPARLRHELDIAEADDAWVAKAGML